MADALIAFAVWMIASVLFLLLVTVFYLPVMKTRERYQDLRDMLALMMVLAKGVLVLSGLGRMIWNGAFTWGDMFVPPLMAAWFFGVFFLGLYLAARMRGVLKKVVQ